LAAAQGAGWDGVGGTPDPGMFGWGQDGRVVQRSKIVPHRYECRMVVVNSQDREGNRFRKTREKEGQGFAGAGRS
jgi:hypothetical protein